MPFLRGELIWHNPSLPETRRVRFQLGLALVPVAGKWLRRGKPKPGLLAIEQASGQGPHGEPAD